MVAPRSVLPPQAVRFDMTGELTPLRKSNPNADWVPTRPFGGWLATWAKIGPNGGLVPTVDREGHWFEAARALGTIEFDSYLGKGRWNDTHLWDDKSDTGIIVGVPTSLEYHDETSPLAKAHGKVGWWTEGHLLDRNDPQSWLRHGIEPTSTDLERADYYDNLSTLLKGTPRPIGISAHGKMLLSPCGKRIIWARVNHAAICEIPQNPDALIYPLRMAVPIRRDMVGADPCESCACPPGACRGLRLRKGMTSGDIAPLAPEDLEGAQTDPADEPTAEESEPQSSPRIVRLVNLLQKRNPKVDRKTILGWVLTWKAQQESKR